MTNQFKLGKCMTRGGEEVRIMDIDDTYRRPRASIAIRHKDGRVSTRYLDGSHSFDDEESADDLLPNNNEVVRVRLYRPTGFSPRAVVERNWHDFDADDSFTQCSDTIEILVKENYE